MAAVVDVTVTQLLTEGVLKKRGADRPLNCHEERHHCLVHLDGQLCLSCQAEPYRQSNLYACSVHHSLQIILKKLYFHFTNLGPETGYLVRSFVVFLGPFKQMPG
jgi:hypothetical protein